MIKISFKFIPEGPIDKSPLVQVKIEQAIARANVAVSPYGVTIPQRINQTKYSDGYMPRGAGL